MKQNLKSLFNTFVLTAFLMSTTQAFAYYDSFDRYCLSQCISTACQKNTSSVCLNRSDYYAVPLTKTDLCRGMYSSPYNPMAMITQPPCIIGLNERKECQKICAAGSN